GGDLGRATRLEGGGGGAQGAGGVDDVVDHDAGLALHVADDVHHRRHVGARAALVDDRQVGVVQALGHRAGADHAAHVRRDHDQVLGAVGAPDVGQQQRRGVDVVDRDVEEALDLV